jgi:dolichol-phosphate mannosyltransferase
MTQLVGLICSVGLVLLGAQCVLCGLIAETIVARKWLENDPYSVAERTG